MNVLSVYFFVFGGHINLEVSSCLPLLLHQLYSYHLFSENGLAYHIPEQSFAGVLVFLIAVHEVPQEEGEVGDEHEQSAS